jgi:hypothetical protein
MQATSQALATYAKEGMQLLYKVLPMAPACAAPRC